MRPHDDGGPEYRLLGRADVDAQLDALGKLYQGAYWRDLAAAVERGIWWSWAAETHAIGSYESRYWRDLRITLQGAHFGIGEANRGGRGRFIRP